MEQIIKKKEVFTMSRLLENLVTKAQEKGFAEVNGRKYKYDYGCKGILKEKYSIEIENNILRLKHWGTLTLEIDIDNKKVINVYGNSSSDRYSINFILNEYNLPFHVHYYPSRDTFELHDEQDNVIMAI